MITQLKSRAAAMIAERAERSIVFSISRTMPSRRLAITAVRTGSLAIRLPLASSAMDCLQNRDLEQVVSGGASSRRHLRKNDDRRRRLLDDGRPLDLHVGTERIATIDRRPRPMTATEIGLPRAGGRCAGSRFRPGHNGS